MNDHNITDSSEANFSSGVDNQAVKPSEPTQEQKLEIAKWVAGGMGLSDVQKKINTDFGVVLTYMDVRFLVDDLDLTASTNLQSYVFRLHHQSRLFRWKNWCDWKKRRMTRGKIARLCGIVNF